MKQHQFRSKGISDATEFRFNVHRVPCFEEKARAGTASVFQQKQ